MSFQNIYQQPNILKINMLQMLFDLVGKSGAIILSLPLSLPLRPTPYALHLTPYTLRPTPYALHLTPYTLRPTPSSLLSLNYTLSSLYQLLVIS